jgi:hypothetical protein
MPTHRDDTPHRVAGPVTSRGTDFVVHGSATDLSLNSTALAIWELCDGRTTVREVIDAATTLFVGSPASIERDILATLDELEKAGLIQTE